MSEELAFALYTGALVLTIKLAVLACGVFSIHMGYRLVADGAEGKFHFKAQWKGAKADLASVSPGLLFVLLGCWLCAYAIYVDKPIYFQRGMPPMKPLDQAGALTKPDAKSTFPDWPWAAEPASGAKK